MASDALALQLQNREQIAERIFLSIQLKDRQSSGRARFPVALGIVADVQDFVRLEANHVQRAPKDFRIRLVRRARSKETLV